METCPTSNSQYKRTNKVNHELTSTHLAPNIQYYRQQCERKINLANKRSPFTTQRKNNKKMWYCETGKKYKNY